MLQRREKKVRLDKAKEEVKGLITPENPEPTVNFDFNAVDTIFFLDFLQNA